MTAVHASRRRLHRTKNKCLAGIVLQARTSNTRRPKGERRPSNSPMQGMIADYFKARRGVCRALLNPCCVHDCPVSLGP